MAGAQAAAGDGRASATLALTGLTAASAAGLLRVFSGGRWVGPVFATLLVIHLVCWLMRRRHLPHLVAALGALVATGLTATWTIFGYTTYYGFVTGRTFHQANLALQALSDEFATTLAPVVPTRGFEVLAVGGAALAAALADWCAFRWRSPLIGVLPGLAIFIFCCTSGDLKARAALIGLEVAAICAFLLAERATSDAGQVWFAGIRSGIATWSAAAGSVIAAAAIVAAIALAPALAPHDGNGVLGWNHGLGQNGGERIVPNPLVNLTTELIQDQNVKAFTVTSSAPSYWRLTSLDDFTGQTWISTGSYGGVGKRLPGTVPATGATRSVQAQFVIQALDSPWLPAQFTPVSVEGVHHVTYDPDSGSLLTSASTADGLHYSVSSYQFLDTLNAAQLQAAPSFSITGSLAQDLQLPNDLPATIGQLASTVTAGANTEYDKALAIETYLRGPQFRYTLHPPTDGSGNNALTNFLFVTRAGYCQQFAGAYAVLARAAGLPTRLAVGFVTGTQSHGGYQVYDRDAHTWPEVYFGPQFGWVPFEPTPGFAIPGTQSYTQTKGGSPTGPNQTTPTTVPSTPATTDPGSNPASAKPKLSVPSASPSTVTGHHSGGPSPWLLVVPGAVLAWLALNGLGPLLITRLRRRRAVAGGARSVVLTAWDEVMAELVWHGFRREAAETDDEFADRATTGLRRAGLGDAGSPWAHGGMVELAAIARRARFASSLPDSAPERARAAAGEVVARLHHGLTGKRRLARWWTPTPGTWQKAVAAVTPGRSADDELADRAWAAAGAGSLSAPGLGLISAGEEPGASRRRWRHRD
jgi:transglutaminase-like putative cysteine protease